MQLENDEKEQIIFSFRLKKNNFKMLPKLAVYEEIRINVKNHQIPETNRVEIAEGLTSEP